MARANPTLPQSDVAATYEDALIELERLVAAMEGGQLPLDKLLESYSAAPSCCVFAARASRRWSSR
jgi:exonuclease VII small subunit